MTVAHLIAVPPFVVAGRAQREARWSGRAAVEFSIVIPFHNPAVPLRRTVQRIADTLFAQQISFEIIAVSGGSTDGSEQAVADLPWVRVSASPDIRDKGAALQRGCALAGGAWIGIVDVDGDTEVDPYELVECLHRVREEEAVLV